MAVVDLIRVYFPDCTPFLGGDGYRVCVTPEELISAVQKANMNLYIHSLMDIVCIDVPQQKKRFRLLYHFLSLSKNFRLFIETAVEDGEPVPTISGEFVSAVWYEREAYDMYGVRFLGLSDSRRILMGQDFDGHPLRRDFPVMGYTEVRYDITKQEVVDVAVDLEQQHRDFDFISPWRGPKCG